ncbi:MAG: TIGR04372 family glycosyltransferase [Gammaproteobacteria bacterium]|nr:TIGR04372 family glycosyltransferase [Gammaproteobacteria bacterium]
MIRQIKTIQNGGLPAIGRLLYRVTRGFCLILLLVPVSMPLFILMRLIRPWLLIRLNPISSSRLGHFAGNTELYLCERDAGLNAPNQSYIDLSFYADILVCNKQLGRMWRRHLNIWPAWLLEPVFQLNQIFRGGAVHEVGNNTNSDRDVNNLLEKTAPHLCFTLQEEAKGKAGLERLGVPVGAKFICLIGRDSAYLRTMVNPGGNFEYHNYRDVDIDNFILAAETLAGLGYYVIRMGTTVKAEIGSTNPKVIDYAMGDLRSDFMDVYLGASCFFCISVGSGFDAIPTMFRRPVCYVNMLPIGYLFTFLKDAIAICKKHWLVSEQRWLSLREIFERGLGFCQDSMDYQAQNVEVRENTPEEIRALVLEMVARLNSDWESMPEDDSLQRRFLERYPVNARDKYGNRPIHGKVNLRYGAEFLRDNPAWLT